MTKKIFLIIMLLSLVGTAVAAPHEIGAVFELNNKIYIVTDTNQEGYTLFSDAGYSTAAYQTLEKQTPLAESLDQMMRKTFPLGTILGIQPPRGDVNFDGQITPIDALIVTKYATGNYRLSLTQGNACDVSNDGGCTIADALLVAKYSAGGTDAARTAMAYIIGAVSILLGLTVLLQYRGKS